MLWKLHRPVSRNNNLHATKQCDFSRLILISPVLNTPKKEREFLKSLYEKESFNTGALQKVEELFLHCHYLIILVYDEPALI